MLEKISAPNDIKKCSLAELEELSSEIRSFLINHISKTGGHLASNLGVVELTIALHYVFESPKDKIVWDVGHQSYVHKILTGRRELFDTLRKFGGLSGFPKRNESKHDIFETGHSSTSISAALGIAKARDLNNEKYSVISVIGDGALTGGMAFEALNDAGRSKTNLIVILNHNEMSISKNVGSLSLYLSRLRTDPSYFRFKKDLENILNLIPPIGKSIHKSIEKIKDSIKQLIVPGMFFEEMGFTYLGPIDGHDLDSLIDVLKRAKKMNGPILIHVITKKGKGYVFAEDNPDKFHSAGIFDIGTGEFKKKADTYSDVFGKTLTHLAENNKKIVAITAAMPDGTGLNYFAEKFPTRFYDVGIAEQHAATFAAGMAINGYKPYFAVYSTFLQRAFDQVIHDICIQNLPVVLAVDRAGLVGEDGETHQGVFDISYLRMIPNMTVMAPKDADELVEMIKLSSLIKGPCAIRYPKGKAENYDVNKEPNFMLGEAEVIKDGSNVAIFALGKMVKIALNASLRLQNNSINPYIVNLRFAKPLDINTIIKISKEVDYIFTLEDNVLIGGVGSAILELLNENNIYKKFYRFGFPDKFIEHGDVESLFKKYGLDSDSVAEKIIELVMS